MHLSDVQMMYHHESTTQGERKEREKKEKRIRVQFLIKYLFIITEITELFIVTVRINFQCKYCYQNIPTMPFEAKLTQNCMKKLTHIIRHKLHCNFERDDIQFLIHCSQLLSRVSSFFFNKIMSFVRADNRISS